MKKSLLFAAALVATTSVFAQKAQTVQFKAVKSPIAAFNRGALNSPAMPIVASNAPRRSVATGMYYNRPEGTYYYPTNEVTYLIVPPFTPLTFRNQSLDKSKTQWYFAGQALTEEDGVLSNGDFQISFPKFDGNQAYPMLALKQGADSFAIGDGNGSAYTNYIIQSNSPSTLSYLDLGTLGGYYTYFSVDRNSAKGDEYPFGTSSQTVTTTNPDGTQTQTTYAQDAIFQMFDKPAAPLYLSDIYVPGLTSSPDSVALKDGAKLTLTILPYDTTATSFSDLLAATPIATWTCEPSDVEYIRVLDLGTSGRKANACVYVFSNKQTVMGQTTTVPILINQPFIVRISGFQDEGVDVGFGVADNGGNLAEYNIVDPTYSQYKNLDGAARARGQQNGQYYSYQAPIFLDGYMDVVRVDTTDKANILTVGAQGGQATNGIEDLNGGAIAYTLENLTDTVTGEWGDTYELVDRSGETPSWISYEASDFVNGSVINISATPSTEKRAVALYLHNTVTDNYSADPIYVLQAGATIADGISSVAVDNVKAAKDNRIFNLAGQQVNKAYKGIVIKNGKKYIQK